jgi:predicted kinase
MPKLIMMKGLPASGKSTFSKELVRKSGNTKRVSKDDLRAMFDDGKWSRANEEFIIEMRDFLIQMSMLKGYNIIVDDTNLAPKHEARFRQLVKTWNEGVLIAGEKKLWEFEIKDFTDIAPEVCIERDLKRANSVGSKVIMQMYNQFLAPKPEIYVHDLSLPRTFIFDIDGTLALMGDRSPYDWSKVSVDKRNESVYLVQRWLRTENEIVIVSGRDSVCRAETEEWLKLQNIKYDHLFMRPEGNMEKDTVIKKRIFEEEIRGKFNVLGVFDDRQVVVDMWRSLGLTVFQVAPGDF